MKSTPVKFLPALLITLMLSLASASAQQTYEVNCSNLRLSEVLKEVTRETGYNFVYSNSSVDVSQTVTVNVSSQDINEVLEAVFEGTGITWTLMDKQVALHQEPSPQAQEASPQKDDTRQGVRIIRGQVLESEDLPLPGADISRLTPNIPPPLTSGSGFEGSSYIVSSTTPVSPRAFIISPR